MERPALKRPTARSARLFRVAVDRFAGGLIALLVLEWFPAISWDAKIRDLEPVSISLQRFPGDDAGGAVCGRSPDVVVGAPIRGHSTHEFGGQEAVATVVTHAVTSVRRRELGRSALCGW